MKLEIECSYGDFTVVADWPELWPNKLDHLARIARGVVEDKGLDRLRRHHAATRPKIGEREGLAAGHGRYQFRKVGEKEYEKNRSIIVAGDVAIIDD